MGKKGFNWRARQVVETIVDDSSTKQIKHNLNVNGHYDQSNELVLPSTKRKTKTKDNKITVTRILSKKHRKRLEKIVDRKKKQKNRASLIESLQTVQATSEELSQLTSIASVQTKGLKRHYREEAHPETVKNRNVIIDDKPAPKLNSIRGAYRKKRRRLSDDHVQVVEKRSKIRDPNIVGFESSGSDVSTDNDDEVEVPQKISPGKVEKPKSCNVQKEAPVQKSTAEVVEVGDPKRKNPQKPVVRKPAVFVDLARSKEIQAARLKLPILAEEQQIVEIINENPIVIISGETGSGKTTQVPQFLYEAGYALERQICITEPRRVAAISMSKRVGEEMNLTSKEVSYLIRFEGNVTDETKIKFMTDGVLLKEIQSDFLLTKYSVIILDEAHERRTNNDYLKDAYRKTVRIHNTLPEGGILVFVTGQQEVNYLVNKLRRAFPQNNTNKNRTGEGENSGDNEENPNESDSGDDFALKKMRKRLKKAKQTNLPEINLDDYSLQNDTETFSGEEYDGLSEDEEQADDEIVYRNAQPLWALPLYSMLPSQRQQKVFQPPPTGCRLCIISTNVAETSLTIPNIKYVVDTGKTKMKLYDKITGVTKYVVGWTSKASANQRAGRAGRTGPGHCYRLYSSAVFNNELPQFSPAEIQQKPIDDVYLQLKCIGLNNVIKFPFPSAPDLEQLKAAAHRLEVLGALKNGQLTGLGQTIAKFPVAARFGKMLSLSRQQDLLPYAIILVAALSVSEVLLERPLISTSAEDQSKTRQKWTSLRKQLAGAGNSLLLGDNGVLLKAIGCAEYTDSMTELRKTCDAYGLRHKAVLEIRKLRVQLTSEINKNFEDLDIVLQPKMEPPTDHQMKLLRQVLLSAMGDQIARKVPIDEVPKGEKLSKFKNAYQANNMEDLVFLQDSSVLRNIFPEFVVYQEIYETNKIYMRGVTAVDAAWLPVYVPALCNMSDPLADPPPFYNEETGTVYCWFKGTFGPQAWPLPPIKMPYPDGIDNFKWFAVFFLQGLPFKKLAKYQNCLKSLPAVMTKSWAKLKPMTQILLNGLLKKRAHSKQSLLDAWEEQPNYLLQEYLEWLPQSAHGEVSLLWPPLD
ncbi:hypothetical protein YQE_05954, partial [Dendroctonus ponderosae]